MARFLGVAIAWAVLGVTAASCQESISRTEVKSPSATASAAPRIDAARRARLADFDQVWQSIRDRYAFFAEKATDWDRVRALMRPDAADADDGVPFMHVIERTLDELYDPHCMLNESAKGSWRPVPNDVYAEERDGRVVVTGVRGGSAAREAGLFVGMEIVSVDSQPIAQAIRARVPQTLRRDDPEARQWALLSAVGGRHGFARAFQVLDHGASRRVDVPERATASAAQGPAVQHREIERGIGYISIHDFSDTSVVADVDHALDELKKTRALLIDVRDNGGGDTAVARPVMGRFISERKQYASMARREGKGLGARWPEYVEPRGPFTYTAPVVVLVDRFSVSMAEGFAMGMQGMKRATVVGTRMAGLGAAIGRVKLGHSKLPVQFSTEPVFHVNGTPRWRFVPDLPVDVLHPNASADPILDAGLVEAKRLLAAR
jgi:carboxyl-terminal processing protease